MQNAICQPLRFEPFYRPMMWGGRNLARFLGKALPDGQNYGESWEVSDHALHRSRLATASLHGTTLRQLMHEHPDDLLGAAAEKYTVFPWLIKLLDAKEPLSVQVHPDDERAKKLSPSERGKTEAWCVLAAHAESRIYAGLKPNLGPRDFRAALERGSVVECLHSFTPQAGDVVFLPAGSVHALGGGVVLAEIQQTSDATFRLFDWNRVDATGKPRELHIDSGMACIDWDQGAIGPIRDLRQPLVKCPYFEIERFQANAAAPLGGTGRLQAWIVTEGHGRFANGEYALPGDVWILPAAMPPMTMHPDRPLAGLLCSLP